MSNQTFNSNNNSKCTECCREFGLSVVRLSVEKAVEHAIILEEVAGLALRTEQLKPHAAPIPQSMLDKHFERKHGANEYYGQKGY